MARTLDFDRAIGIIANALDPLQILGEEESRAQASALLDEWILDPAFLVDGAAPLADAVEQITAEEKLSWKRFSA